MFFRLWVNRVVSSEVESLAGCAGPERGQCRYIPAQPASKPPRTVRVPTYPCRERHGLVWVSLEGDESPEPDFGAMEVAGRRLDFCRSFYLGIAPEQVWDVLTTDDGVVRRSQRLGPGSIAVSAEIADRGTESVVAAIQPVSDSRTGLHLLFSLSAPEAARKHVALWGKRLRWRIENPNADGDRGRGR